MMSRTGWPIVGQSCGLVSRGEGFDYQHLSHSAERWYGSAAMTMYEDCALPLQDSDACCPQRIALVCCSEVGS